MVCKSDPSLLTVAIDSGKPPNNAVKAIREPSGDQAGCTAPSAPPILVSCRNAVPSSRTVQIWPALENARLVPSGDQATGWWFGSVPVADAVTRHPVTRVVTPVSTSWIQIAPSYAEARRV